MKEQAKGSTSQGNRMISLFFLMLLLGMSLAAAFRTPSPPWHEWVWLAAYWIQGFIRRPHARATAANIITGGNRDLSEKIGLGAMFVTMGMLPIIEVGTNAFGFADYALPMWAAAIGAALQIPFLWLFWRSHSDLGRNWSATLEVRDGHELVTTGIYAHIRHPMYAAIWCAVIGQPLLVQNWIAGLPILAAFAFMWLVRIPREEAMMRAQFGAAYDDYCNRTGRIWPRRMSTSLAPPAVPMATKDELRADETRH